MAAFTSIISFHSHNSPVRQVLPRLTGGETEAQWLQRWLVAEPALEFMSFDFTEGQLPVTHPLPASLAPGKHALLLTMNERCSVSNSSHSVPGASHTSSSLPGEGPVRAVKGLTVLPTESGSMAGTRSLAKERWNMNLRVAYPAPRPVPLY